MSFWFGTTYFALASVAGCTRAFVPAVKLTMPVDSLPSDEFDESDESDELKIPKRSHVASNVKVLSNLPFFNLSRINGRRCCAERFSTDYYFPSTRYLGEAFRTTSSRGKVSAAFKFLLYSHILGRSVTLYSRLMAVSITLRG